MNSKSDQCKGLTKKIRVFLYLTILALTACTHTVILKHGRLVDPQELQRDRYECLSEATRVFPGAPVQQVTRPGQYIPNTSSQSGTCRVTGAGTIDCNSISYGGGGTYIPPTSTVIDGNQGGREDFAVRCMQARGYSTVEVEDRLPFSNNSSSQLDKNPEPIQRTVRPNHNPQYQSGIACQSTRDCSGRGLCIRGQCRLVSTSGMRCEYSEECASGLECKAGACREKGDYPKW